MTSDLAEFLLARIAEDEAVARKAGDLQPDLSFEGGDADWCPSWLASGIRHLVRNVDLDCLEHDDQEPARPDLCGRPHRYAGDHIARHDPARVLADCSARRAMVVMNQPDPIDAKLRALAVTNPDAWELVGPLVEQADEERDLTLRLLAAPYTGHPDYRAEWSLASWDPAPSTRA